MLLQLLDYIQRQRLVSLQQLSRTFHMDPYALQPLLDKWVARGKIVVCQEKKKACQSMCARCHVSPVVFYASQN